MNTTPTFLSEPQVQYLYQLLELLQKGGLLIPRFQRGYTWSIDQRLDLLRSVRSGIPIGSILVWRTTVDVPAFDTVGGHEVRQPVVQGSPRQYLLDGHQRLSTLLGALFPGEPRSLPTPESEYFAVSPEWAFFYDLETDDFTVSGSQFPDRKTLIPTQALLDSISLIKLQRKLSDETNSEELISRADRVANAFRSYKIPVIPITTDNVDDATMAFQRINSSGTPMADIDMVAALTWTSSFDLKDEVEAVKQELRPLGWAAFDDKYILAIVRAGLDLKILDPDAEQTSRRVRSHPTLIREAGNCLKSAISFLDEFCNVPSPGLLPYSYQAVIIASALRDHSKPSKVQVDALRRWFWWTTYTAFFLGASDNKVRGALSEVREILEGTEVLSKNDDIVGPLPLRYDFRSARSKALLILLAKLNTGGQVGKMQGAKQLFRAFESEAVASLCISRDPKNKEGLSGPQNRFIAAPEEQEAFRIGMFLGDHTPEVLASHAITPEAAQAYSDSDYISFLRIRRSSLTDIEESFVTSIGMKYSR